MVREYDEAIALGEERKSPQIIYGLPQSDSFGRSEEQQQHLQTASSYGSAGLLPAPPSSALDLDFNTFGCSQPSLTRATLLVNAASSSDEPSTLPNQQQPSPFQTDSQIVSPTQTASQASPIPSSTNPLTVDPSAASSPSRSSNRSITPDSTSAPSYDRPTSLLSHGPSSNVLATIDDVVVPKQLQEGIAMLKVSAKKVKQMVFRLDGEEGTLKWPSKNGGVGSSTL